MPTIIELHNRRNNPDLSHWQTQKMFSIEEFALLTCGFDPLEYSNLSVDDVFNDLRVNKPSNWQHVLMTVRAISQAICTQEIKSPCVYIDHWEYSGNNWEEKKEQIELSGDDWKVLNPRMTIITRNEMKKWLEANDYLADERAIKPIQPTRELTPNPKYNEIELANQNITSLLPQPLYTTPALDCLNAVIAEFWIGYDPESNMPPPKQETVIRWIRDNYPDISAKQTQEAIDKICRHPSAKGGGVKPLRVIKDITP